MSALTRGLKILSTLGQAEDGPVSYVQLRSLLDIPPASFARLLGDLVEAGYVERIDEGYRLGLRCVRLALAARDRRPLQLAAGHCLDRIVQRTDEAAELVEFHAGRFIFLDRRQSPRAVVLRAQVGSSFPIHTGNAIGAIALAMGLQGQGRLAKAQADEIRNAGFAEMLQNNGEVYRGAAALRDDQGRCVGCLVVAAPAYRATPDRCGKFRDVLTTHAARMEQVLQAGAPLHQET
jgi:DNA-binding IclR family transcriptional regulator